MRYTPPKEDSLLNEIEDTFKNYNLENKSVLVIIPDNTRTAPINFFFKHFYKLWFKHLKKLDYLIALGTHRYLDIKQKLRRIGLSSEAEFESNYRGVNIYNHEWKNPSIFKYIGRINEAEVSRISHGKLKEEIDISINKMIFEYDKIIILGTVFPHEVVGFSGSNKYLFPGICSWNFIDVTHWLGALIKNINIIGIKETPVRRLIDRARELLNIEIIYFNMVMKKDRLAGLFIGDDYRAWTEAVELSSKLNINYVDKQFSRVVSIPSGIYEDLWTASKGIYKVEPVVKERGEIILYAPNIKDFSFTHGKTIERVGFHIIEYFTHNIERFKSEPKMVLSHCSLVKGHGIIKNGKENPAINVILATGIPEEKCKKANIGYMNPMDINLNTFKNSRDTLSGDTLIVENSGEILYRVKN